MGNTPRDKYERRRQTFKEAVEKGEIDQDTAEAIDELCNAYDENNVMVSCPSGESHRAPGTLMSWLYRLMIFAKENDLTNTSLMELKQDIQDMHDGSHPAVKDDGLTKGTLRAYQAALRKFYGYHDFDIDPDEIPLFDKKDTSVDPNDMLTKREIQKARKAAGNPRDKLIFDLLLYTGQRREALRTLRIKDVNLQEGTFRLNPNVDGLKGANDRNGNRPLLGATATVRNWLEYHPDPDDSDHYLITARPGYSKPDPSTPVSGETIRKVMSNIKEESGISKPMHPHMMRHNFVTLCKREYQLPDDTVKYLIGHDAKSTVMESTYAHLSGDDHVERAEIGAGMREPEDESSLTPDFCRACGEPLGPSDKACSNCGMVYTPDAHSAQEQIEDDIFDGITEAETNKDKVAVKALRDYMKENPSAVAELLNEEKD